MKPIKKHHTSYNAASSRGNVGSYLAGVWLVLLTLAVLTALVVKFITWLF